MVATFVASGVPGSARAEVPLDEMKRVFVFGDATHAVAAARVAAKELGFTVVGLLIPALVLAFARCPWRESLRIEADLTLHAGVSVGFYFDTPRRPSGYVNQPFFGTLLKFGGVTTDHGQLRPNAGEERLRFVAPPFVAGARTRLAMELDDGFVTAFRDGKQVVVLVAHVELQHDQPGAAVAGFIVTGGGQPAATRLVQQAHRGVVAEVPAVVDVARLHGDVGGEIEARGQGESVAAHAQSRAAELVADRSVNNNRRSRPENGVVTTNFIGPRRKTCPDV